MTELLQILTADARQNNVLAHCMHDNPGKLITGCHSSSQAAPKSWRLLYAKILQIQLACKTMPDIKHKTGCCSKTRSQPVPPKHADADG
jgi:hypothetical protein